MVALVATVVVSAFVPQQGGTELATEPNEFTRTTRDFLLVVLLLTPLQAAGEEYAFRGYLQQAFGGLFGSRVLAVGLSALLFALAHGLGQSWPIFVDRLAFGLVAGALVILTGGLEAGIAMHVLNNFLAFGLALAFSDMAQHAQPDRRVVVEPPGHPHPVARLPRPGDLDGPSDGPLRDRATEPFWRARAVPCKVSSRSGRHVGRAENQ